MKSNEDKLYIKVVALNAIYNFVVEKFLISYRLLSQNLIFNFKFQISKSVNLQKNILGS